MGDVIITISEGYRALGEPYGHAIRWVGVTLIVALLILGSIGVFSPGFAQRITRRAAHADNERHGWVVLLIDLLLAGLLCAMLWPIGLSPALLAPRTIQVVDRYATFVRDADGIVYVVHDAPGVVTTPGTMVCVTIIVDDLSGYPTIIAAQPGACPASADAMTGPTPVRTR